MEKFSSGCGISVNVDGIENDKIHCPKEDEVAAVTARAVIQWATTTHLAPQVVADGGSGFDPFADLGGKDANENNDELNKD